LLGAAGAVVAANARGEQDPGREATERYVRAWSAGDDRKAAKATTRPGPALVALRATRRGMDGGRVRATVERSRVKDGRTTSTVRVTWTGTRVPTFTYDVTLVADRRGEQHLVRWRERNVHPALNDVTRFGTVVLPARRGEVLDRRGRALITERPVVDIAVEVARVRDPAATATAVAQLLDVSERTLERRIRAAPRSAFIPVLTLRRAAFREQRDALDAVPGVTFAEATAPLGPTRDFAGPTLGSVGPPTAEQVQSAGGRLAADQPVGRGGLQAQLDGRLRGEPERAVITRQRSDGIQEEVLRRWPGRRGRTVRLRLDRDVQGAAERALADTERKAALVAIDPRTGDVLAVANRPRSAGYDRALLGRYPPGSTFKVVTAAALLRAEVEPQDRVSCPKTTTVDGRAFRNFEGGAAGMVSFAEAFAQSCNTAMVSLTGRLGPRALPKSAADFGLMRSLQVGVPVAESEVPEPKGLVAEAAAMIGQDRVLASPLTMAGVAAAVVEGRWRAPRLLDSAPRKAGPPIAEAPVLRDLMRRVVLSGTGVALAGLPGDVIGKSGTAEYGGGDPPPTHAWFIAARPDVAVAVLVEGGKSGGAVAAPLARDFLGRLPPVPPAG